MTISSTTRYVATSVVILAGAAVELARGYRTSIVVAAAVAFLLAAFIFIYAAGTKERAARRQQKRDFYAGLSE